MTRVGVYILTTGAPVRIETIHVRRRPPRSEITVGQDYTQRLPATKDYDLFVSNAGPVGQAFGSVSEECYRLQVEAAFDDGNSWELACFLAHALARHGHFAAADAEVDEIVLASGRVDLAFDVGAVEHLQLKFDAARKTIEEWRGKGVPVTLMLPAPNEDAGSLLAPEGAEILFCGSVAEVMAHVDLPWKAPKVPRATPRVWRRVLANRWISFPSLFAILAIIALGLALPSRDVADPEENDGLRPIEFQLSSGRGGDPAYRIGEKLDLTMRTDRDAWIYCYYSQADGKIRPILPNPEFWKQESEPRFAGGVVHHVPSPI